MKNLTSLIAIFVGIFFLAFNVSAASNKEVPKTASNKSAEMASLNQTISINVESRQLNVDSNGQALAVFKYAISNVGNKPISGIDWLSVYVNNREVVHSQEMKIDLASPLMPGKSLAINLQVPFVQIQEKFRPIFMDTQAKIDVYPVDRIIRFSDKKELRESK
ncbi:hypothetical protein [Rodentibacter myodis]|uniref:Uncharacterized protein n=1 Tax=Rodentibacter myodis TaxID=1907939 RepID=A0A1V3JSJ9_9PAST|nr:hypothetical protein [Rodentibacter myodis]OOF59398.1 hypothetical protein BKL49_04830 [Rodentibacter myodis]